MIPLRATYRLQLNANFTFADALHLVPYLADLGVSHAYLSPILKSRPGSTHGYDIVDHTMLDPELGTLDEFRAFARALQQRDMGIILDIVPNHMGIGGDQNWLWLDVLRHGPGSQYANWFDIDWQPPRADMAGKVLVPFLGTSYAEALAAGDLQLRADDEGFSVWAYGKDRLPIRPEDCAAMLAHYHDPAAAIVTHTGEAGHYGSWAALDALIASQHWRLSHFAAASDEINYRRFFINSDLVGIRVESPEVFEHTHRLILMLIEEGMIDGLRVDHIDGLANPKGYLHTLRAKVPAPVYLFVEKILAPHEQLRADWPVEGTTGYEFGALLTRVLTNPASEAALTQTYQEFTGDCVAPETEAYRCRLRVMDHELAAELATLARSIAAIAWSHPATRDLSETAIRNGLREVLAHLAVYRSYVDDAGDGPRDRRELLLAVGRSRRTRPSYSPELFDFLARLLTEELGHQYDRRTSAAAIRRFQQLSGPVMAKGLEDTALYRSNRLLCLNEVGAHPQRFSVSIAAFHDGNARRLANHPQTLLATTTHDTKRGEDQRAIISAIADLPDQWHRTLSELHALFGDTGIATSDQYAILQQLLGGWPIGGHSETLADRLKGAMRKFLREARLRSDWSIPNSSYEQAVDRFIDKLLANSDVISRFRHRLIEIGQRKALVQLVLKLTVPGVPDIYRGAEDWEQSYVDPDNRRPVDFSQLKQRLRNPSPGRDDKLFLTQRLLQYRRAKPELFANGDYLPIDLGEHILTFSRSFGDDELLVLADLSPGHQQELPSLGGDWQSLAGGRSGPFRVLVR
jgi:(1->4)-alpha-D-glucan 1-alpha-D-glucosylmutase